MRLTPLDIKKQDFGRVLRGFDPEEVQAFLSMVADEWEDVRGEHRRMESKLQEMESKLEHYERVEEALQEALQTAREQSQSKVEQAERQAALTVQEARAEAREIVQEAKEQRQQLQSDIVRLADRRDEVVARLRALLNSELEVLSRFEDRHPREEMAPPEESTMPLPGDPEPESPSAPPELDDELNDASPVADEAPSAMAETNEESQERAAQEPSHQAVSAESSSRSTSEAADEAAEAGEVPFTASEEEGAAYARPATRTIAGGAEELEEDESEVDEALFDFFDIDSDEESTEAAQPSQMDQHPAGEVDTYQAHAAQETPPPGDSSGAEQRQQRRTDDEASDEIERIRRMLDELE